MVGLKTSKRDCCCMSDGDCCHALVSDKTDCVCKADCITLVAIQSHSFLDALDPSISCKVILVRMMHYLEAELLGGQRAIL